MAVEIVSFPSQNDGSFHGYVKICQRVNINFPMIFPWFSYGFSWACGHCRVTSDRPAAPATPPETPGHPHPHQGRRGSAGGSVADLSWMVPQFNEIAGS